MVEGVRYLHLPNIVEVQPEGGGGVRYLHLPNIVEVQPEGGG